MDPILRFAYPGKFHCFIKLVSNKNLMTTIKLIMEQKYEHFLLLNILSLYFVPRSIILITFF